MAGPAERAVDAWVDAPILATVTRSGFIEGHHRGAVVGLAHGHVQFAAGPVDVPVFGRSANKPLQASGVLRAGAVLDDEGVAIACASHSGQPAHIEVVCRVLRGAGLDERALANTPALPIGEGAARAVLA